MVKKKSSGPKSVQAEKPNADVQQELLLGKNDEEGIPDKLDDPTSKHDQ